jgi:hypothetical protein
MEEVRREELLIILQSFPKDKIPGLYCLPMELFLGCFYFIEEYLRSMVKATRIIRKMLGDFNATFITLIPKVDNPTFLK